MKWSKVNNLCIQSGPYKIAKQGQIEVSYMLTHAEQPHALGWFATSDEAKQAAEDDAALFGGRS